VKSIAEEKTKSEVEKKQLANDLKATQLLIQLLQKEASMAAAARQQAKQEEEAPAGDKKGLFDRHHKQVKEYKEKISELEAELSKLKKEEKKK